MGEPGGGREGGTAPFSRLRRRSGSSTTREPNFAPNLYILKSQQFSNIINNFILIIYVHCTVPNTILQKLIRILWCINTMLNFHSHSEHFCLYFQPPWLNHVFFSKERKVLVFSCIIFKRTHFSRVLLRSLLKERCILCVLLRSL